MRRKAIIGALLLLAALAFTLAALLAAGIPASRENIAAYAAAHPCNAVEDNPYCYQVTDARVAEVVDSGKVHKFVLDMPYGPQATVDFAFGTDLRVNIGEPVEVITWRGDIVEVRDDPRVWRTAAYPSSRDRELYGSIAGIVAIGVGLIVYVCGGERVFGMVPASGALLAGIAETSTPIVPVIPFVAVAGGACLVALAFGFAQPVLDRRDRLYTARTHR